MGVNLGGMLGPLAVGYFAQDPSFKAVLTGAGITPEMAWHFGFLTGAVGMFFGLVQYTLGRRHLPHNIDTPLGAGNPELLRAAKKQLGQGAAVLAVLVAIVYGLNAAGTITVTPTGFAAGVDVFLVVLTVGFFVWLFTMGQWTAEERKRLVVIMVLFLGAAVFWAGFEQAASTLNLFAARATANTILGWEYPAAWLQSVNSLFIVIFAPVVGWVWLKLGTRNPSSPTKFTLGLFFLSVAYGLMIVASLAAAGGTKVSPMWLVGCYFIQTAGELCLSPVGLSAMSTLAPARVQGLMMGVWFLASSIGNKVAGRVGGLYESYSLPTIFSANTVFVLVFAIVLGLLILPIKRMTAGSRE
jgi:POT family proton-dependent oligopeptide transporter